MFITALIIEIAIFYNSAFHLALADKNRMMNFIKATSKNMIIPQKYLDRNKKNVEH